MGSDATAFQEPTESTFSYAARKIPEGRTASESVRTVAAVNPTESEIATVAYQLWLDNGCPIGSDWEDWFRAEAILKNALVAKCVDLSRHPPVLPCDTCYKVEVLTAFRYAGHWEVWESEWGGARWTWDSGRSMR
jgi:hypothetical protein